MFVINQWDVMGGGVFLTSGLPQIAGVCLSSMTTSFINSSATCFVTQSLAIPKRYLLQLVSFGAIIKFAMLSLCKICIYALRPRNKM